MENNKGKDRKGENQTKGGQNQENKQESQDAQKSLKDKFKDLAEDIAAETKEGVDKLGKEAKKKFGELREENKDLEENLRKGAKKMGDKAKEMTENLDEETRGFQEKAKHVADEFSAGAQQAYDDLTGTKDSKRIFAGVMGIIFGALGLHKFILGYTREGMIMLLVSLLSFGFLAGLMALIGLVEGIVYLSKSEEEFYNTYQAGKKPWF